MASFQKTPNPTRVNLSSAFGATPTPFMSTSPIDIIINTSRNIKVKKEHCFLYDKMTYNHLILMLHKSNKQKYYKELFDDVYDGDTELTASRINNFFEEKQLLYSDEKIVERVGNDDITLFVIPVTFDYAELSTLEGIEKFISDTQPTLFGDSNTVIKEALQTSNRIYFLPCLMGKKLLSESEYVSKIREELYKLKEFIDTQFREIIRDDPRNHEQLYKSVVFFFNPNGKLSLEFYKKKALYNKSKNSEFLNKHLFKQIGRLQSYGQLERNLVVDEKLYTNPIFVSKSESRIKTTYIKFLVQKIFELEILSVLDLKNVESFYDKGITPLHILYKKTIKKDLYDFDTKKLSSAPKYRFTFMDSDEYIIFKLETQRSLNQKYHKIKDFELSPQVSSKLKSMRQYSELYLKITSSGSLKKATIFTKKRNFYEEQVKGVLTINPENEEEDYKELKPSNLTRGIQAKRFYYIEVIGSLVGIVFGIDAHKSFLFSR